MSRSRRKPIFKEGYKSSSRKKAKKEANSCVRNSKELAKGSHYKKKYCSWNISDWRFDCRWDNIEKLTKKERAKRVRK